MSSAEEETFVGHVIGNYQLKRILGKGGASVVFLGERMTPPQQLAAIKVLLPPTYLSAKELIECRRRFIREILTLRERLRHPSILPILASGEDPCTKMCLYGGTIYQRRQPGRTPHQW